MKYSGSVSGEASALLRDFKIGATVTAGQVVIWDGTNGPGTITDPTSTAAADTFGITTEAGTYAATAEVNVETIYNPFAIYEANASGGATAGTALATTGDANVLVNETADTARITVTDDLVGTASFVGGMLFSINRANKGQSRVITAHTNSTSTAVTVEFASDLAVDDRFVRLPWAPGIQNVQLTGNWEEANAIIVTGTGIAAQVVHVLVDDNIETAPTGKVYFCFRDHFLNPLS